MTVDDSRTSEVLGEVNDMINKITRKYGSPPVQVTMDTFFHSELELESIDLVTLGVMLAERYGDDVSMAEFLADKDLDDVIALRVGEVVDYVVSCLDVPTTVD
ncbi:MULTISPECIES: phosphopantetheine-binding protein [unclassified Pseudofrankia]|uniref:phosphopantetheine-binding protein n=1 Tax=unclassified Pseudofrankia TaxID=2994372 RepID=UPI0008D9BC55|nr:MULTISPECIES: phosphopantetheine-binding protein [unclassified Pseudofrankia]MDT3442963.1 acyl carrier protein [Pseudofrankia sp. BMG5.37]OHV42996.1 acyl carrier protein [Pseudofrankia sp. BMG5.36]